MHTDIDKNTLKWLGTAVQVVPTAPKNTEF